jgi:hypothetical protein
MALTLDRTGTILSLARSARFHLFLSLFMHFSLSLFLSLARALAFSTLELDGHLQTLDVYFFNVVVRSCLGLVHVAEVLQVALALPRENIFSTLFPKSLTSNHVCLHPTSLIAQFFLPSLLSKLGT